MLLFAAVCWPAWSGLLLPSASVPVLIKPGMTAGAVAAHLKAEGLIFSTRYFLLIARLREAEARLQPGSYRFSPRTRDEAMVRALTTGQHFRQRITIPEGFTAQEIAARFASHGLADQAAFLREVARRGLEGRLFPDTYFFSPGTPVGSLLDAMEGRFERVYGESGLRSAARAAGWTDLQVVTLASLIEKEARTPNDRLLISGVFHNRMRRGWLLESCASVQYALGGHRRTLTYRDLAVRSPYNTYRRAGLPPGPICNPGKAALIAALEPATTEAMFFVVGDQGTHVFSRYLADHLKAQGRRARKVLLRLHGGQPGGG